METMLARWEAALEDAKIAAHLSQVLKRLRAKPLPVDPALRRARLRSLAALADYAAARRFPRNASFPGRRVPHIRDASGTLCAMGHVAASWGETALVDSLARDCNTVRISEVSGGPLIEWLASSGLTKEEANMVQPGYDFMRHGHHFVAAPAPVPLPEVHLLGQQNLELIAAGAALAALGWLWLRVRRPRPELPPVNRPRPARRLPAVYSEL